MQVEERLHQGGTKAAESKHRALRRHHLRPVAHRESQCVCERIPVCVCVCGCAGLSWGGNTHRDGAMGWWGWVAEDGWSGGGGGGSAAISVELIPQPVTGLSAAVIHTHAHTHTYEHWSH